jgi:hypothetical protein
MARATKAEIARRVGEVGRLMADCMGLPEIRAYVNAKTSWGPSVSDATLRYYMSKSRAVMKASADFDYDEKFGMSIHRLERIIARSAAKGDLRTELAADGRLAKLLDLCGKRGTDQLVDAEAARAHLAELLAQEDADDEDTDSTATRPRPRPRARRQVERRRSDRPGG